MVDFHRAVRALYPNVVIVNGETAYDKDGNEIEVDQELIDSWICLLYTSPSPRDVEESRMPSSA